MSKHVEIEAIINSGAGISKRKSAVSLVHLSNALNFSDLHQSHQGADFKGKKLEAKQRKKEILGK